MRIGPAERETFTARPVITTIRCIKSNKIVYGGPHDAGYLCAYTLHDTHL